MVSVPDGHWSWASTLSTDYLSWGRAAITDVKIFIPDVSGVTNNTLQVDWIPMFWFIAPNTEFSSNIISIWAAALSFVGTETIIW